MCVGAGNPEDSSERREASLEAGGYSTVETEILPKSASDGELKKERSVSIVVYKNVEGYMDTQH
jgi:hypothetical protein